MAAATQGSSQGSAQQSQNADDQGYRPDLNNMNNLNLLPEYQDDDPIFSMSIEDMSRMLNDDPVHLQSF
ncbi:hypothetical protein A2U01_0099209, partial [Trifolium medium]|nr:hypothetical protein [Trifolium medium]